MIRAPKFSSSITGVYTKDFSAGTFEASATLYYSTKFYLEVGNRVYQPAYTQLSGRLAFKPEGSRMRFELWGKNLTNEAVISGAYILQNADNVGYAPPRTYGVALRYDF
jgi:iron complex outermembrane receptor protein